MQVKGRNYLVPVGADIASEDEAAAEALEVDAVLAKMETARNRLNILVLDACRNNPFGRSFRGSQQGLAQVDAPTGTFVAFATAPGRTAADGGGANGLYTAALLRQLGTPGLRLEDVFKRTRAEVLAASAQQQTPWENSSIVGDFYFLPGGAPSAAPAPMAAAPASPAAPAGTRAPAPSAEETRLLDLVRSDSGSTLTIRKAAKPLADRGSIYGQFALGWINKKRNAYYEAARTGAGQGIPLAMAYLAEFLAGSPVSPDDPAEARRWLDRAIAQGEPHARFVLGKLLVTGKLGDPDIPGGERIFADLSRERPEYCWRVGEFYWKDVAEEMPAKEADAKGLAYYRRAAELQDPRALDDLGFAYESGWHVPKDPVTARMYYTQGAGLGDGTCMLRLAEIFRKEHDGQQALRWYQGAADHGEADGLEGMGNLYREGKDVPRNLPKAAALFRAAGEQGYPGSQQALGEMYEKGQGVPRSDAQAYFWYARAAAVLRADKDLAAVRDRAGGRLAPGARAKIDAQVARLKPPRED
jgi:TPR repeat protein